MFLGKRLEAHSLSTSVAFHDLLYAPVHSTLFIHEVILLGRANKGQEFLNSFESIYPGHSLFTFLLFSLLQTECCVFYEVLSIINKSQFILSFCFSESFVQIGIIFYIHSLVSGHVFWRLSLNRVEDSFYLETPLFLLHQDCLQFQRQTVHMWTSPTLVRHLPLQNCKTAESLLWIYFLSMASRSYFRFLSFFKKKKSKLSTERVSSLHLPAGRKNIVGQRRSY